jgi:hypothetical protein
LLIVYNNAEECRVGSRGFHWDIGDECAAPRALALAKLAHRAEGLSQRGQLIVANHPTLLDALLLMSPMPQADCVAKERYYRHPFLGSAARGAGYIVSRDGPRRSDETNRV